MKYFINTFYALSSELRNKKGAELYELLKSEFEHKIFSKENIKHLKEFIEDNITILDKKYPRMSRMKVVEYDEPFSTGKTICVKWIGKKEVEDTCIKFHLIEVRGGAF